MKRKLLILSAIVFIIKALLLIHSGNFETMNPDEESNFLIATNYLEGKNYTNSSGELSSFHGSFTVFLYQYLIQNNISKESYIIFYHFLALLVFVLSISYFYKLLRHFRIPENIAFLSVVLYSFYPSNIYYIGNLFTYEKFVLPILIFIFYLLLEAFKKNIINKLFWTLPILVSISCLFRAQLIFVYFLLFVTFGVYAIVFWRKQKVIKEKSITYLLTGFLMILTHFPLLNKNHKMFGKYILSTQIGYELMQGHNDFARGSWFGGWSNKESMYYKYSKENITNLDDLNEYEEGIKRKEFALNWIKNNPKKEMELVLRKTGIFILPKNYETGYNIINIIVHLMFISAVLFMILRRKIDLNSIFILSPIIAVYTLCQIFFVGLRWRYYVEPFFILFATYQIVEYAYAQQWLKRQ